MTPQEFNKISLEKLAKQMNANDTILVFALGKDRKGEITVCRTPNIAEKELKIALVAILETMRV